MADKYDVYKIFVAYQEYEMTNKDVGKGRPVVVLVDSNALQSGDKITVAQVTTKPREGLYRVKNYADAGFTRPSYIDFSRKILVGADDLSNGEKLGHLTDSDIQTIQSQQWESGKKHIIKKRTKPKQNSSLATNEKLIQSPSKDAFSKNVSTEIKAGKPQKQAVAIAYDIQRKNMKKKVKESADTIKRYSDVVPKEKRKYWYFTTHGVGPGSIPKGINVLDTKEGKNRKGTDGTFVLLDAVLNTDELKKYDMIELNPNAIHESNNYADYLYDLAEKILHFEKYDHYDFVDSGLDDEEAIRDIISQLSTVDGIKKVIKHTNEQADFYGVDDVENYEIKNEYKSIIADLKDLLKEYRTNESATVTSVSDIPNWFISLYQEAKEKYGDDRASQLRYITRKSDDHTNTVKWLNRLRANDVKESKDDDFNKEDWDKAEKVYQEHGYAISLSNVLRKWNRLSPNAEPDKDFYKPLHNRSCWRELMDLAYDIDQSYGYTGDYLGESKDGNALYKLIIKTNGNPSIKDLVAIGYSEGDATDMVARLANKDSETLVKTAKKMLGESKGKGMIDVLGKPNDTNEGLQGITKDFANARKQFDKYGLDIKFDDALKLFNKKSKLAEPDTFYAKPLYNKDAFDDLVKIATEECGVEEVKGGVGERNIFYESVGTQTDDCHWDEKTGEIICDFDGKRKFKLDRKFKNKKDADEYIKRWKNEVKHFDGINESVDDLYDDVKEWYVKKYPDDELGVEIGDICFADVVRMLNDGIDVYDFIPHDSIVRERIFGEIANRLGISYTVVYNTWLHPERNQIATKSKKSRKVESAKKSSAKSIEESYRKYTQKEIRDLIRSGMAQELEREDQIPDDYEKIGLSTGLYGMNGGVIKDRKTGEMWAIPVRNSMLFRIF